MNEEIRSFLKREKKETEAFLKAWFSAGVKKYGMKWSHREYELRNE